MRTKEHKRRTEILIALSDMSRAGWKHSTPTEYERLERELAELDRQRDLRRARKRDMDILFGSN